MRSCRLGPYNSERRCCLRSEGSAAMPRATMARKKTACRGVLRALNDYVSVKH